MSEAQCTCLRHDDGSLLWNPSCERHANVRNELAAPPGSVPDGFSLLKSTDYFSVGDIVADCEGKWRGPIPQDSDMVGREIRGYLCSNTWGAQPACRAAARRNPAPNDPHERTGATTKTL